MFDYLGVLLSVVLGLALTNIVSGLSSVIQMRQSIRIYWVQLVWAAVSVIYVLGIWWGMFWWRHLTAWRFDEFLFLIGYAILIFMMATILFPSRLGHGADLEKHFYANRRWFFGLLVVTLVIDVPETVAKQAAGIRDVPIQYVLFLPFALGLALIGWATGNRRVHAVIALAFISAQVAFVTLGATHRITAG